MRQVHDMALETSEMYNRHRYSAEFCNHHSVNFETDSYVMFKEPAFAKTLATRRTKGLATRLLLQWSGPHKVIRMIGTNNCEIVDRDDNKPFIVNVVASYLIATFSPVVPLSTELFALRSLNQRNSSRRTGIKGRTVSTAVCRHSFPCRDRCSRKFFPVSWSVTGRHSFPCRIQSILRFSPALLRLSG